MILARGPVDRNLPTDRYLCSTILSFPLIVMTGEPDCQKTLFPLPVTVILLQEPSRVTVLACPLISASLPLQVKVHV